MTIAKRKQAIIGILLIIGLLALIYLAQRQQILKGRATSDPSNAFDIEASDPNDHVTETAPNTYSTDTLNIKIKLEDPSLLAP